MVEPTKRDFLARGRSPMVSPPFSKSHVPWQPVRSGAPGPVAQVGPLDAVLRSFLPAHPAWRTPQRGAPWRNAAQPGATRRNLAHQLAHARRRRTNPFGCARMCLRARRSSDDRPRRGRSFATPRILTTRLAGTDPDRRGTPVAAWASAPLSATRRRGTNPIRLHSAGRQGILHAPEELPRNEERG